MIISSEVYSNTITISFPVYIFQIRAAKQNGSWACCDISKLCLS